MSTIFKNIEGTDERETIIFEEKLLQEKVTKLMMLFSSVKLGDQKDFQNYCGCNADDS